MLDLILNLPRSRRPRALLLGAHCDDIEIGCGGTLIELRRQCPDLELHWVVLSATAQRAAETRHAAELLLGPGPGTAVQTLAFRESYFPGQYVELKDCLESLKALEPDFVFTHSRDDLHQDHRLVAELTGNTFRDHLVLEYEIPKYDGGLGSPQAFTALRSATVERKIDALHEAFPSQRRRNWFTPDTFRGLMRLRGVECNAPSGFAEAFDCRKLLLTA